MKILLTKCHIFHQKFLTILKKLLGSLTLKITEIRDYSDKIRTSDHPNNMHFKEKIGIYMDLFHGTR